MKVETAPVDSRIIGCPFAHAPHARRPRRIDLHTHLHKEWLHFCVLAGDVTVSIHFSISGDHCAEANAGGEGRVAILAYDREWQGDIEVISRDQISVRAGRIDAHFGSNSIRLDENGVIAVEASLSSKPVSVSLRFEPATTALLCPNTVRNGAPMHSVVVPRLLASGTVRIGDRSYHLKDAPAYHDHNWGKWRWGHDFGWTWGFGLPDSKDDPWCAVFTCPSNLARTPDPGHGLFLWKNQKQHRIFQEGSLHVHTLGLMQARSVPKFPRITGLAIPESNTGVPRGLEIDAKEGVDRVRCVIEATDLAQIVVPNEMDCGYTIINEVIGRMWLCGTVGGERVSMEGRAAFELLGGG